ncbi:MAG: riboflavin synthase, partial [Chloroflexi bacterium]|nr:riboflavin synthase [Chloroflexota bacterium]
DASTFTAELMPETRRRTNLGSFSRGDKVNLERALAAGGRFGGHFVQGHVDATGRVVSVVPEGEATLVRIQAPPSVMRYVVEKGFIAMDGVSLTVVDRDETSFRVSLVRYTQEGTTLGQLRPGKTVNLEVDILAKYVERIAQPSGGLTEATLEEKGFSLGGNK